MKTDNAGIEDEKYPMKHHRTIFIIWSLTMLPIGILSTVFWNELPQAISFENKSLFFIIIRNLAGLLLYLPPIYFITFELAFIVKRFINR